MSRWVIIAGLTAVLLSLVALATLAGGSNRTENVAAQESSGTPEPETTTPSPSTTPAPTPGATTPGATTPGETTPSTTTPNATTSTTTEQGALPGPSTRNEGSLQGERPFRGVRPSDQGSVGAGRRVVTIETTGDSRYSCSIGLIGSPRTVRGSGSDAYQIRVTPGGTSLDTVMAVCQKISGEELGVGIIYDDEVKAQGDTMERFGTVSVSWSPVQQ